MCPNWRPPITSLGRQVQLWLLGALDRASRSANRRKRLKGSSLNVGTDVTVPLRHLRRGAGAPAHDRGHNRNDAPRSRSLVQAVCRRSWNRHSTPALLLAASHAVLISPLAGWGPSSWRALSVRFRRVRSVRGETRSARGCRSAISSPRSGGSREPFRSGE